MAHRRPYLFPDGASLQRDNVVLHARSKRHRVTDYAGPLSIKSVLTGEVLWTVQGRDLVVDANSFLVLGDGEKYSMNVDVPRPVETCCAFFQRGFVEAIARDATTPLEASLDDPFRPAPGLLFLSRLHLDPEGSILLHLRTLAKRCADRLQPSGFEEDFIRARQKPAFPV